MRIDPISESDADKQAASLGLWPAGDYDYEVRDASEETSSAGNDMIKLEVWVFSQDGGRRLVFDYIVSSEKSAWKIRHFAASCGLLSQYERGTMMANECVGRAGRCTIGVQAAKGNFEAKNIIRDYVKVEVAAATRPAAQRARQPAPVTASRDLDDEIPF